MKAIYITLFVGLLMFSCHKNDYPCPGLGQSSEADLSLFDENGELKSGKKGKKSSHGKIDHTTGLVNKKKPKKIAAPRKTHL